MSDLIDNINKAQELAEAVGESCALKDDYDNAWKIALVIIELQCVKEKLFIVMDENK